MVQEQELMLLVLDFHVCAPARMFACLPWSLSLSLRLCPCLRVSVYMHSFKIVKIFSRLKALQRIVVAISNTVYPLFNTFVIFLVVVSIFAVLSQQLYGDLMFEEFGTFSRAGLTMFQS